jgi:serine/threonine-protein kinase RsbW
MPSEGKKLTLTIESRTEKLRLVREFIADAARDFGFDIESVHKIALAVDEACTNVIKHSYRFAEDQEIEVAVHTRNGAFEVIIYDRGISFDPNAVHNPDMKEYLQHYRKGGLGMYLMRSLMDKIEYKSAAQNRNEMHLTKYLRSHKTN